MSKQFVIKIEKVSINLPKKPTAATPPDDPVLWFDSFGLYFFLEEYHKTTFIDCRQP